MRVQSSGAGLRLGAFIGATTQAVALIGALAVTPAAEAADSGDSSVRVTKEVSVIVPDGWSQLDSGFSNMIELVSVLEKEQKQFNGSYPARLRVQIEPRLDPEDAVRRLREVAVEWNGPTEYILVGGWPALDRRYDLPIPRRGKEANAPHQISPSITVAVAYGNQLIRVEGHLQPDADPGLREAIARSARALILSRKGDAKASRKTLDTIEASMPRSSTGEGASTGHEEDPPHFHIREDLLVSSILDRYRDLIFTVWDLPNTIDDPVLAVNGGAEISIAASNDGQNVVVATNGGFSFSNDGAQTFTFGGGTPGPNASVDGDPSVTWAQSDTFYYGYIAFPNGTAAWGGAQGCSTGISASTNGGQTFPFVANATFCPNTGAALCFPDQEHIAADQDNAAAGGDQVYSVWRDFAPTGTPANCRSIGTGTVTPSIVCSQDSGANWTAKVSVGTGDFPRVGVGSDGFVYVTFRSGGNIMLNKFSSCSNGLNQQAGFPVTVATFNTVACPVPGLDRCNNGNLLSSPTVAVSDTDSDTVFVAFATNTAAGNDNVVVRESRDGGSSFPRSTTVSTGGAGRRFMPWVCAENGRAYVSYYDRRDSTAANNDLTGFHLGEAISSSTSFIRGNELDLTGGVNDAQCASGWPCRPRNNQDSESCSVQPQNAGRCLIPGGGGSNLPCDFSNGCANFNEVCVNGGGCPKYGDYNYSACAAGRIFTSWASATPPAGVGAVPAGINTYVQVVDAGSGTRCDRWNCMAPVLQERERLIIECAVRGCNVFDPIPKNCLVKWDCPGCGPDGLCPPYYEMSFEGFDPDEWTVALIDADGQMMSVDYRYENRRHVLGFRPDEKRFIDGQIGDYVLVFTLGPKGIPGKPYEIRTSVEAIYKEREVEKK